MYSINHTDKKIFFYLYNILYFTGKISSIYNNYCAFLCRYESQKIANKYIILFIGIFWRWTIIPLFEWFNGWASLWYNWSELCRKKEPTIAILLVDSLLRNVIQLSHVFSKIKGWFTWQWMKKWLLELLFCRLFCFVSGILLASMIYFYQGKLRSLSLSWSYIFFSPPSPIERKVMCASQ